MPKSRGEGEFAIEFMQAATDRDSGVGELFIDFEEKVWTHLLIEALQAHGASQVSVVTFPSLDGGEAAADALVRIHAMQAKTGGVFERGDYPSTLLTKVKAKQAAAAALSSSSEFDQKTLAAMAMSLEQSKEVIGKVGDAVGKVDEAVQMQVVQLGEHGVKLGEIENGVCNVIPDYQREIQELKAKLAHKTAECNRIEGQKGNLTRIIHIHEAEIKELKSKVGELVMGKVADERVIENLRYQADLCKGIETLNRIIEDTQFTTGEMTKTFGDNDRDTKRARE